MMDDNPRIIPLSERTLIVKFGSIISEDLNILAINFAEHLLKNPFPGFIEAAPAFSSVCVRYDPSSARVYSVQSNSAFDSAAEYLRDSLANFDSSANPTRETHSIPVYFGGKNGLDLSFVADYHHLSEDETIRIFTDRNYRVYMLGFLPGFAYLAEVDERIATPRRTTPRVRVPAGSIGIADRQTGIYPLESPGGWQLIGRTEAVLFLPDRVPPCRLRVGDHVKFTIA